MKKIILLATVFVSCSLISFAQSGVLDSSFGINGVVSTAFGNANGRQVLIKNDKTIYFIFNDNGRTLITHILVNGTIDTSYGDNGYSQSIPIPATGALQSDGKIVVAGRKNIFRFNTNGSLDEAFSVQTAVLGIQSVAIQQDGKIVVVGYSTLTSDGYDFAIARYNSDGTPDTTFSEDGKQTTDFGFYNDVPQSVAIQSDGKILVAGYTKSNDGNFADFALVRYNTDGTPDSTFSGDGKQTSDFASGHDFAKSVAVQSDGKIVVAGISYRDALGDYKLHFALARYNVDGSPDTTFSEDGRQTTEFNVIPDDTFIFIDGIIQSEGKIVVAGFDALARYNTDGSLDTTFSADGKQITNFQIASAAIQSDGKLVVAGTNDASGVARYLLNEDNAIITLEAEEAVLNGAVVASNHPGFTGSGFADYLNPSCDFIEWTVNAAATGSYSLTFRYANGGSANRPLELKVNGTTVNASLGFLSTGSWTAWLVSSTTANLMAGTNKIRLTAIGWSGPNVDHLAFSYNEVTQLVQRYASAKSLSTAHDLLKLNAVPNPANNILNIQATGLQKNTPLIVSMISSSGVIMKSQRFASSTQTIQFNVSSLVGGVYTIKLISGNRVMYKQFVKL